jgi:hypothetical protein
VSFHVALLYPWAGRLAEDTSEEPDVVLNGGDDLVHLPVQRLPGQAEGEAGRRLRGPANAPYSSWRTCTKSTEPLRRSASITGFSASPAMP